MAINTSPGTPVRHVATFNSSGNWNAPQGVSLAFVSVHGATGGGGGRSGPGSRYSGAAGGSSPIAAGWVQVNPGNPHTVTVGAGGVGGTNINGDSTGNTGGAGGTSSFDGAITITGGNGGVGAARYNNNNSAGNLGASSATTSLPTVNPSATTTIRVASFTSQQTGAASGGNSAAAGSTGIVHIFV